MRDQILIFFFAENATKFRLLGETWTPHTSKSEPSRGCAPDDFLRQPLKRKRKKKRGRKKKKKKKKKNSSRPSIRVASERTLRPSNVTLVLGTYNGKPAFLWT